MAFGDSVVARDGDWGLVAALDGEEVKWEATFRALSAAEDGDGGLSAVAGGDVSVDSTATLGDGGGDSGSAFAGG